MSLKIGSLYVSLTANSTGLVKGFAEAAKAAERVAKDIKKASNEVAQVAGTFALLGGAALKLASSVDGPTKKAMAGLESSTKLLAVQIADMLLPAVRAITQMFQTMAGMVAGLDPETKKSISSFAVLAVQLAVGAKALSLVASIGSQVFGALSAVGGVIAGIGVGPILAIGAAIGLVAAGAAALHYAFRTNLGGIADAWKSLVDWLGTTWNTVFGGVLDTLGEWASKVLLVFRGVLGVMEKVARVRGDREGALGYAAAGHAIEMTVANFGGKDLFKAVAVQGLELGKAAGSAFIDEWKRIASEMGLTGLFKGGKTIGLGRGMGPTSSTSSGHEGMADMALAAQADAAARALSDIAREAAAFKKSLADVDAGQQVRKWLKELDASPVTTMKDGLASVSLSDPSVLNSRRGKFADAQAGADANAKQAADEFARQITGIVTIIGASGKQLLGAVGDLVDSIVQGAKEGGIWGAIIAAFMEIAKKTESAMKFLDTAMAFVGKLAEMLEPLVKPIFDALTDVLATVLNMVGPLFSALQPLFNAFATLIEELLPVFDGLGYVIQALSPIIEMIGNLVGGIIKFLKPVFDLIGGVLKVVATVVLGIIIAANEIAAAFGDEKAKAESARLKGLVDQMWDPNAQANADNLRANTRATIENTSATSDLSKATESLSNVPTGYKLALGRWSSDMGITPGNAFAGAGGGGTTINGDVYVTSSATTVNDLAEDAAKEARRDRGQEHGNPHGGSGRPRPGKGGL
jgi:hypothetical protein